MSILRTRTARGIPSPESSANVADQPSGPPAESDWPSAVIQGVGIWDQSPIFGNAGVGVVLGMKKINYHSCALLIVALACATFAGCQTSPTASSGSAMTAGTNADAGRLIIRRAADLGSGETLLVSIDGVKVSQVREGDTYTGPLSPGQHVLSVILEPNQLNLSPTVKRLTVKQGQTYTFTAMWQGGTLVLL